MGGAYSTHGREIHTKLLPENMKGR